LAYEVAGAFDVQQTRRETLKLLGAVAAWTGMGAVIDFRTDQIWPPGVTEIETVPGCHERPRAESYALPPRWLAFGGYGRQRSRDQADVLASDMLDYPRLPGVAAGLNHPNQGVLFVENAERMSEYVRDTDGIKLFCHSMGFLTAMYSLLAMENPPHVDEIMTLSSPTGLQDVVRKDDVRLVVESGAPADVMTKFIYTLLAEHDSDRGDIVSRAVDVLKRAYRNSQSGVSPMVCLDQLQIIYHATLLEDTPKFKGIITPQTKFTSCITTHDGTVHYRQAGNSIREFATDPMLGAQFQEVSFDGGHADGRVALRTVKDRRLKGDLV
jgi:hypothetical protein